MTRLSISSYHCPCVPTGWDVLALIALSHLVQARVLFLECVTHVDRCLPAYTQTGIDPSRVEWQGEDSAEQLGDKLHSGWGNVTGPETAYSAQGELRRLALLSISLSVRLSVLLLMSALRSTEVLSFCQHRSESLSTCLKFTCSLSDLSTHPMLRPSTQGEGRGVLFATVQQIPNLVYSMNHIQMYCSLSSSASIFLISCIRWSPHWHLII